VLGAVLGAVLGVEAAPQLPVGVAGGRKLLLPLVCCHHPLRHIAAVEVAVVVVVVVVLVVVVQCSPTPPRPSAPVGHSRMGACPACVPNCPAVPLRVGALVCR
jgi:hypothetical protein